MDDELAMVCDAYGLPPSAVALARHLASNAELDHAVNTETIALLVKQRDEAVALAQEAYGLLEDARCSFTDPGLSRRWGQRRRRFRDRAIEILKTEEG